MNLTVMLLSTLFTVIATLWALSNYTGWILHRVYDKEQDRIVKAWTLGLNYLYDRVPMVLAANYAAMVNVLSVSEPPENSSLPAVRIWLENNGLEKLNSGIFQYGMGFLAKKPRIKGFYQIPNKMYRRNI